MLALVSFDILAAFDMVNHKTLISRLESEFGVAGTALEWISSYLQKKSIEVCDGSSRSTTVQFTAAVPHGSVLGPILFTTYVFTDQ